MQAISSMTDVFSKINSFIPEKEQNENCWIAFDVDYTLTVPAIEYNGETRSINHASFHDSLENIKEREDLDIIPAYAVSLLHEKLIDESTPEIIKKMQEKEMRIFALTACLHHEKLNHLRENHLNTLGINFKKAFDFSEVLLDEIEMHIGAHPGYLNGVLYTNGQFGSHNKGTVLKAFMEKIKKVPSYFVIIDDRKKNLEQLQQIFSDHYPDTKFLGILYSAEDQFENVPSDFLRENILGMIKKEKIKTFGTY